MAEICGQYIKLPDGNQIFGRFLGPKDGKVIVLLHGLNVNGAVWSCVQHRLVKKGCYRTVALDLPGQGKSSNFAFLPPDPPAAPIPAISQFFADEIVEAIKKITHKPVILIANSIGGFLAQIIALQHPELLSNLVLIGTSPKFSPDAVGFWMPPKFTASPAIVPVFFGLVLGTEAQRRAILEASVASSFPYSQFTPEQQQTYIAQYLQMLEQQNKEIGVANILALQVGDLRALVPAITTRTLIINGGVLRPTTLGLIGDAIAPWGASQFLNEAIPNSQLVIFSNLGHTPQIEDPRRLTDEILNFLHSERPIKPCIPMEGVLKLPHCPKHC